MTIDGTVVDVMETWPLQLSVRSHTGLVPIALSDTTVITSRGRPAGAGAIRPGTTVQVEGEHLGTPTMIVRRVDVRPAST